MRADNWFVCVGANVCFCGWLMLVCGLLVILVLVVGLLCCLRCCVVSIGCVLAFGCWVGVVGFVVIWLGWFT